MSQSWPEPISIALDMLLLNHPPDDSAYVDGFTSRWGSVACPDLLRALDKSASVSDRLFAIIALGYSWTRQPKNALLPTLDSDVPIERWAGALVLGEWREERAYPMLETMLTEFLPPTSLPSHGFLLESWRPGAAKLLGAWGNPHAVPLLRRALLEAIRCESLAAPPPSIMSSRDWVEYEDVIIYALGRLQAWGALVDVSSARLPLWQVHMAMGSLHGRHALTSLWLWRDHHELASDISHLLEHRFGLTEAERTRGMQLYDTEKSLEVMAAYAREIKGLN